MVESDMTVLILGLLIFLGVHSVRIVAEDWPLDLPNLGKFG